MKRNRPRRKKNKGQAIIEYVLIIAIVVVASVAILGVLWWLGNSMSDQKPDAGEVRMEIEHVL